MHGGIFNINFKMTSIRLQRVGKITVPKRLRLGLRQGYVDV